MQPDSPFNGLEGLKHMATAIVPPIYDAKLADRNIEMETEAAYAMAKHLGRDRGPAGWHLFRRSRRHLPAHRRRRGRRRKRSSHCYNFVRLR